MFTIKPCPQVPHQRVFGTLTGIVTPPLPFQCFTTPKYEPFLFLQLHRAQRKAAWVPLAKAKRLTLTSSSPPCTATDSAAHQTTHFSTSQGFIFARRDKDEIQKRQKPSQGGAEDNKEKIISTMVGTRKKLLISAPRSQTQLLLHKVIQEQEQRPHL